MLSGVAFLSNRVSSGTEGVWAKLRSTTRATYGMLLAHAGIGIFVLGVTLVNGYETSSEVRVRAGDTTTLDGYTFQFLGVKDVRGPNYEAAQGIIEVTRQGNKIVTLYPEKLAYTKQSAPMTEAAINTTVFRDLYVALGELVGQEEWTLRIMHKPMVYWIWGGCFLMALGGLLAVTDRRYRHPVTSATARVVPV